MAVSIPLRVKALRESTRAVAEKANIGPVEREIVVLICDRCGHKVNPLTEELESLRRWRGSKAGDLCPTCAGT